MTDNKKTMIYIGSGLLIGLAVYFVIRGSLLGKKKPSEKPKEIIDGEIVGSPDDRKSPDDFRDVVKGGAVGDVIGQLTGLIRNVGKRDEQVTAVASKAGTRLRKEPNTSSQELKSYPNAGVRMVVFGQIKDGNFTWYKVREGGLSGWVRNDAISIL